MDALEQVRLQGRINAHEIVLRCIFNGVLCHTADPGGARADMEEELQREARALAASLDEVSREAAYALTEFLQRV